MSRKKNKKTQETEVTPPMTYKEALEKAQRTNKALSIDSFISNGKSKMVSWLHGDGSYFEIENACVKKIGKDYIAIFTEHHGVFVYHTDDVDWVKESLRPSTFYVNKNIYK